MKDLVHMMRHFISLGLWPYFPLCCYLASIAWYEVSLKQAGLWPRKTLRWLMIIIPLLPNPVYIRTRSPNLCWKMSVPVHILTRKLATFSWVVTEKLFYSINLKTEFYFSDYPCRPLIRHENGAFPKHSLNRRNSKTPTLHFSVDGKRFENRLFRKRWRGDKHMIIFYWPSSPTISKWRATVAFWNFSGLV